MLKDSLEIIWHSACCLCNYLSGPTNKSNSSSLCAESRPERILDGVGAEKTFAVHESVSDTEETFTLSLFCFQKHTSTFALHLGSGRRIFPLKAPTDNNKRLHKQNRPVPISKAEGGGYSRCLDSLRCNRRQPLTLHRHRLCSPADPGTLAPGLIHSDPPQSLWRSRCRAGSPPAGSGCLGQTAMSPAGPTLRNTNTLILHTLLDSARMNTMCYEVKYSHLSVFAIVMNNTLKSS